MFPSKLYCGSQSSFYCPPPLAKPTLLHFSCTTIAQHTPPPADPSFIYAIHHTILAMAISCKGLGLYKIFFYFSSRLYKTYRPVIPPAYLHCPHCCNTIARLLGNLRPPLDLPCVCCTPYNIGNTNIVQRPLKAKAPSAGRIGGGETIHRKKHSQNKENTALTLARAQTRLYK